jgi:ornithine cyclodeaminase
VRPIREARIWARDAAKAEKAAADLTLKLGFPVWAQPMADPRVAVPTLS